MFSCVSINATLKIPISICKTNYHLYNLRYDLTPHWCWSNRYDAARISLFEQTGFISHRWFGVCRVFFPQRNVELVRLRWMFLKFVHNDDSDIQSLVKFLDKHSSNLDLTFLLKVLGFMDSMDSYLFIDDSTVYLIHFLP